MGWRGGVGECDWGFLRPEGNPPASAPVYHVLLTRIRRREDVVRRVAADMPKEIDIVHRVVCFLRAGEACGPG